MRSGAARGAALAGGLLGFAAAGFGAGWLFPPVAPGLSLEASLPSLVLAIAILAMPATALTESPSARRRVVALVVAVSALLFVVNLGLAFGLDAGLGLTVDGVRILDGPVGLVTLGLLVAGVVRAALVDTRDAVTLTCGAAALAGAAFVGAFASPHSFAATASGVLEIAAVLAFAAVGHGLDLAAEREKRAFTEADRRNEKLATLGTLVAGVAHEINNPLTYIQGHLEFAVEDVETMARAARERGEDASAIEESVRGLRKALDGTARINRITRALKTVARNGSGERKPVDLREIARETAELLRIKLPDGVAFDVVDRGEDLRVLAAPGDLHQVLLNLTKNALEAVGDGPGRVVVLLRHRDSVVEVRVSDDGPGIPEDVQARLFTPFFTTKPAGTGLGLSIAHSIVEEHGGHIRVESAPGAGTTFVVRLPAATPVGIDRRLEQML